MSGPEFMAEVRRRFIPFDRTWVAEHEDGARALVMVSNDERGMPSPERWGLADAFPRAPRSARLRVCRKLGVDILVPTG
jgi:hypothetical protein